MHNPTFASRVVQSIVLVFLYGVQADSIKAQVEIEDRLNSIEKCRSIIASAQRKLAEELLNLDKESDALQKLVPEASISRDLMGYAFTEEIANLERSARSLSNETHRLALLISGLDQKVTELVNSGISKERAISLLFGSGSSELLPSTNRQAFGQPRKGTFNMLDPDYTVANSGSELTDERAANEGAESMKKLRDNLVQKELERFEIENQLTVLRQKQGKYQEQTVRLRTLFREIQSLKKLNGLYIEQLKILRSEAEVGNNILTTGEPIDER